MLISVAMDPACIGAAAIVDFESREAALVIVKAVCARNAVLLCGSVAEVRSDWLQSIGTLTGSADQRVRIAAEELLKNLPRLVAVCPQPVTGSRLDRLRIVARSLYADVVVCVSQEDVAQLAALDREDIEVCRLSGYRATRLEAKRLAWLDPQRLDRLSAPNRAGLLGRIVKYCDHIEFFDPYLGAAANSGQRKQLELYIRGVTYVAEQWARCSPYRSEHLPRVDVVFLTKEPSGQFDNCDIVNEIRQACARLNIAQHVRRFELRIKADSSGGVFKERYIRAGGRAWLVGHGIDDLGRLSDDRTDTRTTWLNPCSVPYAEQCDEIGGLPGMVSNL